MAAQLDDTERQLMARHERRRFWRSAHSANDHSPDRDPVPFSDSPVIADCLETTQPD